MKKTGFILCPLVVLLLIIPVTCFAQQAGMNIGAVLPLWSILPFAGILLSIALMPLFLPHIH